MTSDPTAYEEYLRGLQLENSSFDEAALRGALAHFDRAIARDSGFAGAFAGQANVWSMLADGYLPPREAYGRARDAARRALDHDSTQALAYAKLAEATLALDLDAREGERLARQAVGLDPRSDGGHSVLSRVLFAAGQLSEGVAEARRAWESDSLYSFNGSWYASVLRYGHQLDSAAAFLPRFRAVAPPADADVVEGFLLAARGDLRDAAPLLRWRYYGGRAAGMYVRALLARGDTMAARATVDSMLAARTSGYFNPLALASAYTALGDIDRGMEWLRRAFEERTIWLIFVRVDDELAPLRADPRYAALDSQLRY